MDNNYHVILNIKFLLAVNNSRQILPFFEQPKRNYKEPTCRRCGKSKSKNKNEHPSKRFCSDGILSIKLNISFPHVCEKKPCNCNI